MTPPNTLKLTPVYLRPLEDDSSNMSGSWYVTIYDPNVVTVTGVTALFSTVACTLRSDAIEDARTWCKTNRPDMKIIIGG